MNKELLNYIRTLTNKDTKTLSQKALKTAEEVGELAKKVLPYEGAAGTNHRIVAREGILEEVADIILCALSVAYSLKATDEELVNVVTDKAGKWSNIQSRDCQFPIPFEIHITVNLPSEAIEVERFKWTCGLLDVKPIVLDLQDQKGTSVMTDVMTSSKHFGSNTSALETANLLARSLEAQGYKVVRTKLESTPWHPLAPQEPTDVMPRDCYFESHIPITTDPVNDVAQILGATFHSVHISRNVFKKLEDGRNVVMLTYRQHHGYAAQFKRNVEAIIDELNKFHQLEVGKVHTEFAVYDTKVSHDATWLK